jgi:plasmid stabilization system protein ParE
LREAVFTESSKIDLAQISDFICLTYSFEVNNIFLNELYLKLNLICQNPQVFASSKRNPEVRKCVVHKNISFFYKVTNENIIVLAIIDNRQNPEKSVFS